MDGLIRGELNNDPCFQHSKRSAHAFSDLQKMPIMAGYVPIASVDILCGSEGLGLLWQEVYLTNGKKRCQNHSA